MKKFSEQAPLYLTWAMLFAASVLAVYEGQWYTLAVAVLTLIVTLVPILFQKRYSVYLPPLLISFIAFFAFATIFLGEASGFYYKFWWWDLLLHLSSAIAFGLLGVIVLLLIFGKRRNESHPFVFAFFSFCFAVTIGVLWEIFEFFMDQTFGFNMQKSGLVDTMSDLMLDCIGASIAALAGYLYIVDFSFNPFNNVINKGYLANKSLSKRANKVNKEDIKEELKITEEL